MSLKFWDWDVSLGLMVHPSFDPVTKTWFVELDESDPDGGFVEASTLASLRKVLPPGSWIRDYYPAFGDVPLFVTQFDGRPG